MKDKKHTQIITIAKTVVILLLCLNIAQIMCVQYYYPYEIKEITDKQVNLKLYNDYRCWVNDVEGNRLFIANSSGFVVLDRNNPEKLEQIAEYQFQEEYFFIYQMLVWQDILLITGRNFTTNNYFYLYLINISSLENIQLITKYHDEFMFNEPWKILMVKNTLFWGISNSVLIYNLTDIYNINYLDQIEYSSEGEEWNYRGMIKHPILDKVLVKGYKNSDMNLTYSIVDVNDTTGEVTYYPVDFSYEEALVKYNVLNLNSGFGEYFILYAENMLSIFNWSDGQRVELVSEFESEEIIDTIILKKNGFHEIKSSPNYNRNLAILELDRNNDLKLSYYMENKQSTISNMPIIVNDNYFYTGIYRIIELSSWYEISIWKIVGKTNSITIGISFWYIFLTSFIPFLIIPIPLVHIIKNNNTAGTINKTRKNRG